MIAGRKTAIALVLMMTATSFGALFPAAGTGPAPVLTVTKEWTGGPYNDTPNIIVNDTDGDGHNEMVVWLSSSGRDPGGGGAEEHWIKVYDLPNYTLAWSLDLTVDFGLELADLGHNGSVEFLLEEYDYDYQNFTAISGKDYSTLWTSPDFGGSIYDTQIIDVDADGDLELVFVNQTYIMDNMSQTSDARIHVFNADTGNKEWESAAINESYSSWEIANIDNDAALEILYVGQSTFKVGASSTLSVYDGATGALEWTFGGSGFSSISLLYHGDVDKGRAKEVVVESDTSDGNSSAAGIHVLAGADGSDLWNISFENATVTAEAEDINNDSVVELLVSESVTDQDFNVNQSFLIYELKSHKELWSLGPFTSSIMQMGSSSMTAQDLTGDGVPELIVTNITMDLMNYTMTHSFDVFDGKSLSLEWSSPELSGYSSNLDALPLDSDKDWEIVLAESWTDSDGNEHGVVHVYSTASWTEEWKSDDYGATVYAIGMDAVNDSRPEILVELVNSDQQNGTSNEQMLIIDSDTHTVLFTSPWVAQFQSDFADLYGSPRNEIILASVEGDMMSAQSTQLVVYNDTTFQEAWKSEKQDGDGTIEETGDFDGDGRGELMLQTDQYDEKFNTIANLTVYEFQEKPATMPDLAIAAGDLTLSNATPMAGTPVVLSASVHNPGDAGAACATVALFVDGTQAAATSVDVPAGGTAWANFTWTARVGDHVLTVRLDPRNLIAEWNEDNNNASVNISVSRPTKPVAVISSPTEGQQFSAGDTITFDGSASFAPEGSTFYWTSEQDGYLGGVPVFNTTLPSGDHYVSLFIDDGHNNVSATVNFTVEGTPPPPGTTWAVITSPRNGAVFAIGDNISFDGSRSTAAQAGYVLTYRWASNLSGALGNGSRFSLSLPAGSHNITLGVDDGHGGSSSASVNIRVKEPVSVRAVIFSPSEGQSFEVAQSIPFDAAGSTGPAGAILTYLWSSSIGGPLSTQKAFSQRLAAGDHTISLTVTDGQGHSGTALVNITVKRSVDYPPIVNITSPADGATVSGTVTVTGTAWDDLKVIAVYIMTDNGSWGAVTGTDNWTYVWNTNTSRYPNGPHRITVKASDDTQSSPQLSVTVMVNNTNPVKPPVKPAQKNADNMMLYAGVGIAVVIVVVAAVAILSMKRRGPPGRPVPVQDSRGIVPPRM